MVCYFGRVGYAGRYGAIEWQIQSPIENVATQALKVATGERKYVQHLNRSDELLTLRAAA